MSTLTCQWFLRCTRDATGTTPHPVLGDVPTCDRCHAFATDGAVPPVPYGTTPQPGDSVVDSDAAPAWTETHAAALDAAASRVDAAWGHPTMRRR